MKRIIKFVSLVAALVLMPLAAAAQGDGGSVSGLVVDGQSLSPLAGVSVQVNGTTRSTVTDARGRYQINNIPTGQRTINVSLLGYTQGDAVVSISLGTTATANFSLSPSAVPLQGVSVNVNTGQAESRRMMGTNTANIDMDDLVNAPINTVADALTARASGVVVQATSGTTGTNQRIRIRGANSISLTNEPIIFVDGIQYSNQFYEFQGLAGGPATNRINDINPADIENIEVLKGPAATSQYGTAAANGVILITTRKGQAGITRWAGYAEYGTINDENDWPASVYWYQLNQSGAPVFLPSGRANTGTTSAAARQRCYNIDRAAGLCRQDSTAVFNSIEDPRTTPFSDGFRRKFGANVSGGTGTTSYFVSADMEDETGVISYNQLEKIGIRANFDAAVTDRLQLQVNTAYLDSDLDMNSNGNTVFSPIINGLVGRAFFNPDTTEAIYAQNFRLFAPDALEEYIPREAINRLTLGGRATYNPESWLSLSFNTGLDFTNRMMELTVQPNRYISIIAPSFYGVGSRDVERTNKYLWTANASASAVSQPMPRLNSTTTVGASFRRHLYRTLLNEGAGMVEGTEDLGGTAGQFFLDEEFEETKTFGAFLSQQFGYDDRLFVTAGLRGDDDSAFGSEFGFIYYPNANFSWLVDQESWFPESESFSSMRFRAGYGTSGLRPGFRSAEALFGPTAVQVNGEDASAVLLSNTGNPGLEPERTTEYEAGIDAGFFNDRLGINLTYYHKKSDDALISVPLEPSFGLTNSRLANVGSIRNKGFEFGVNAQVLDTEKAVIRLALATTTLDNEILSIGGDDIEDIVINRGEQRHRAGYPAGAYFQNTYRIVDNGDGFLRQTGEVILVVDSIDGEPVPNFIGPTLPTLTNAISGDVTLYDFLTIGTLFEQRSGNYMLDLTTEFVCRTSRGFNDRGCAATGDPSASLEDQAAYIAGTFLSTRAGYISPADFVKWRELSVTLSAPSSLSRRYGVLSGATLTLAGRNLKTWTDYKGMDPEGVEDAGGSFNASESNTQPPVRYWTARMNFNF